MSNYLRRRISSTFLRRPTQAATRYLLTAALLGPLLGCTDAKVVASARMEVTVRVDTVWVVRATDGSIGTVRLPVNPGDTLRIIW